MFVPLQNLAFIFATDLRVERICIIARSKKEKFTISSEGCTFQSKIEEGIKISFPEGAVCKDEHIEVEVKKTLSIYQIKYLNYELRYNLCFTRNMQD